jgi:hypothetical protein
VAFKASAHTNNPGARSVSTITTKDGTEIYYKRVAQLFPVMG